VQTGRRIGRGFVGFGRGVREADGAGRKRIRRRFVEFVGFLRR